ncbi:hypothetical protein Tco_0917025, partial [Tanacetum coccineum]
MSSEQHSDDLDQLLDSALDDFQTLYLASASSQRDGGANKAEASSLPSGVQGLGMGLPLNLRIKEQKGGDDKNDGGLAMQNFRNCAKSQVDVRCAEFSLALCISLLHSIYIHTISEDDCSSRVGRFNDKAPGFVFGDVMEAAMEVVEVVLITSVMNVVSLVVSLVRGSGVGRRRSRSRSRLLDTVGALVMVV